MDGITIFDKLIHNLSTSEKKELLEKMEMTFELSQEPLVTYDEVIENDFENFQKEYESLGVFQKILLFLQSIFKQKDIPSLLKEQKILILRKKFFSNSKLADFKHSLLNEKFYEEIANLKEPFSFFRKPLQQIFNYDDRQDFYAFIGGIILPDLQQDLLKKTDPWEIEKNNSDMPDGFIKGEIDTFLELKMDSLSDLDCTILNEACQSLYGLYLLCKIDMNHLFSSFERTSIESGKVCRIDEVQDQLLDIAGVLKSLEKPPTVRALEALFLYSIDPSEAVGSLNNKMNTADVLLSVIRTFNKNVPLENLIKVLSGDLSKEAITPPIVEDWFRVYKKFWHTRSGKMYSQFIVERKKNESEREICAVTEIPFIRPFDKYSKDYYWQGSPAKYEKSIAFVQAFISEILINKIYPSLMVINRDGEFYKKDNREEFEKVLNYLSLLDSKILSISKLVSNSGFIGEKIDSLQKEKEEKFKADLSKVIEQVDIEVMSLLEGFVTHMRILNHLMHGIVIGNGGAYDTLSNISSIGGSNNSELREKFKVTSIIMEKIIRYISEMKTLEEK